MILQAYNHQYNYVYLNNNIGKIINIIYLILDKYKLTILLSYYSI